MRVHYGANVGKAIKRHDPVPQAIRVGRGNRPGTAGVTISHLGAQFVLAQRLAGGSRQAGDHGFQARAGVGFDHQPDRFEAIGVAIVGDDPHALRQRRDVVVSEGRGFNVVEGEAAAFESAGEGIGQAELGGDLRGRGGVEGFADQTLGEGRHGRGDGGHVGAA